jgi:hypothetical protein
MIEEKPFRKLPPLVMPKSANDLFEFLSYGEPYEGESDEDFSNRKATLDNLIANMNRVEEVKKKDIPLINKLINKL